MTSQGNWLREELSKAIFMAYENDAVLFSRGACERSVVFRIARYLAPVIEDRCPRRLWVDCEYNRIADATQHKLVKRIRRDSLDLTRSVLPDLIVHDRTGSSRDHNILVVEAKKHPASSSAVEYDQYKLRAYKSELHYRDAVYLELGTHPRWQWLDLHDDLQPVGRPQQLHPGDSGPSDFVPLT